ncbi:hypothetical protein [Deinococcus altitudinis]|uniref:hypothetical protein n=1 Tax=Deinococcus altitudinis TaxID=468914 RepID=UPI0038914268
MDAADHNEGVTEQPIRYIITRPCLAEGSLRLLKYLRPLFPSDGQVQLQDGRGELFTATVETATGRLSGVGELYRAHNLGVNDVLHLRRAEERRYLVECVVKPHARSQPSAAERPAPAPVVAEKRVVIHATPHVREVRMERVSTTPVSRPQAAVQLQAAEAAPLRSAESHAVPEQSVVQASLPPTAAQAGGSQVGGSQAVGGQLASVRALSVQGRSGTGQTPASRSAAPIDSLTARLQQSPASRPPSASLSAPIQIQFPAQTVPEPARPDPTMRAPTTPAPTTPAPNGSAESGTIRPAPTRPATALAATQESATQAAPMSTPTAPVAEVRVTEVRAASAPLPAAPRPVVTPGASPAARAPATRATVEGAHATRPHPPVSRAPESSSSQPSGQQPGQRNPEDQLTALARLTGYACEHLGGGVVRLQAELGTHSYSVLIATTPQALTTPAWSESCDYMALLTPEDQRPQGIPRFTYAALDALLEHARLAPLTPIDLRGYWNTGSFDQESVESVAELVSAHLAQRGSFSHVLLTLAQQPAHSLVQLPRLAERLGSGVNTAELQSILETLSRPPFQALTPLPNGQFYLRSDVRDLLQEFGEYAEGMRRRIRPAPLAATGR